LAGKYFEDIEIGEEYTTTARTITESDVMAFAGLSGDYNTLHTDSEFAKQTIFGQRIAHGLLGLAVSTGLKTRMSIFEGTVMAFLGLTWNFKGPIFFGDTVHAKVTIKEKRDTSKSDRGIMIQNLHLINQRGQVVQEGEHTIMLRRRPKE